MDENEEKLPLQSQEPVIYEGDGYVCAVVVVDPGTGKVLSETEIS